MEVTDALKSYVENALGKVIAHFDKVIDADVVLSIEKHRQVAEVNLHANGVRIHGRETSPDLYASVDAVVEKIDRQVQKYKDRINRHKPRHAREARIYEHAVYEPLVENGHEAPKATAELHREIHREKVSMHPMTVDEAVMQLALIDEPFLVFSNAETSQVNVLYARENGHYGLIEPQF